MFCVSHTIEFLRLWKTIKILFQVEKMCQIRLEILYAAHSPPSWEDIKEFFRANLIYAYSFLPTRNCYKHWWCIKTIIDWKIKEYSLKNQKNRCRYGGSEHSLRSTSSRSLKFSKVTRTGRVPRTSGPRKKLCVILQTKYLWGQLSRRDTQNEQVKLG